MILLEDNMRQPIEVLIIPYKQDKEGKFLFGSFLCKGDIYWAAMTGGVEDDETPLQAAMREAKEEAGIPQIVQNYMKLDACATTPASWVSDDFSKDVLFVAEYCFAVRVADDVSIHLSDEHSDFKWLSYQKAFSLYKYDLHKIALWELNYRLTGIKK